MGLVAPGQKSGSHLPGKIVKQVVLFIGKCNGPSRKARNQEPDGRVAKKRGS
jgi:hypothetical protein